MRTYRPHFDVLEDRTVPALLRHIPVPVTPPATHLQVIVPSDVEPNKAFDVVVTALDARNHAATAFKGTVQFSLTSADPGATMPSSYAFTTADHGRHTFHFTLDVSGAQTVKAVSGALTGKASLTVDTAVTHFGVYTYASAWAGSPTLINVVALDVNDHAVAGYMGTVHFNSTDLNAILPDDYKFTTADRGSHLFMATFATAGRPTLAVTDIADGSLAGGAAVKVNWPWYYSPYVNYPSYWYNPFYANHNSPWF